MKAAVPAAAALLCASVFAEPAQENAETRTGHIFAWPFMEWEKMKPRGGTTQGSEVTLRTEPKEAWKRLQEPDLPKRERDRRAILAMAGNYRVSFDFVETLGFSDGYQPPRPYFSWGTEHVAVLEDRGDFVSLQHSLVMYFKNDKGETDGPHVMKHWRQDWTWEDQEIHRYRGDLTWQRERVENPTGRWSQAVFQVDDSPRYEVAGEWTHEGGLSTWRSDNCPRPLPRREHTVRKDYNVLEGFHEITLSPTGWLHVQNNRKVQRDANGSGVFVGMELGVSRYEEITAPDLATAAGEAWEKTGPYWQSVRDTWATVLEESNRFTLKPEVDGKKLWELHFTRAGELEKDDSKNPDPEHAQSTIRRFLGTD